MRKLKLNLEMLQVESFDVSSDANGISTIQAYAGGAPAEAAEVTNSPSCPTNGCGTCYETCWNTCEVTCPGTSGPYETIFEDTCDYTGCVVNTA